jgi:non-specific serine/threonine protein kinase
MPVLLATLLPYQHEAVEWCLKNEAAGGILAYDMGLGKTVIACATMVANPVKTLVMCPTGLLDQWASELAKHTTGFAVATHYGSQRHGKKALAALKNADIVLSTPQIVARDLRNGLDFGVERWVIDEAHRLKNPEGKAYEELYQEASSVGHKLLLTGTPVCNHPNDLMALVCLLNRPPFNSLDYWKNQNNNDRVLKLRELAPEMLLRRTKEDTIPEKLPPLTIRTIPLKLPAKCTQRDTYNSFVDDDKILRRILRMRQSANSHRVFNDKSDLLGNAVADTNANADAGENADEKEAAAVKITALSKLLAEIPAGEKTLVFSQFTSLLRSVHSAFPAGSHLIYHGGLSAEEKKTVLHRFKTSDEARVLFINLRAGGCGLNLVEANHVVLLEPYWNEAEQKQAIDRTYRIGQTRPVFLYRMYLKYTIEAWMQALQKRKRLLANFMVDFEKCPSLTPDELVQSRISSENVYSHVCFQPALEEGQTGAQILQKTGEKVPLEEYLESQGFY